MISAAEPVWFNSRIQLVMETIQINSVYASTICAAHAITHARNSGTTMSAIANMAGYSKTSFELMLDTLIWPQSGSLCHRYVAYVMEQKVAEIICHSKRRWEINKQFINVING